MMSSSTLVGFQLMYSLPSQGRKTRLYCSSFASELQRFVAAVAPAIE
jgi:hypothetical protein